MLPRIIFILCLLVSASGFVSPPVALAMGLVFGLALPHPYGREAKKFSKFLLQASVVGLGFGMNLHQVVHAGRSGFVYTMLGISFALLAGMGLGALLGVQRVPAFLISTGTAICGGSAIAAVGPITQASDEEMAVALGTVFVLNSVALLIFPAIGTALKLTQSQFGLWAALAIHDTSSVVGAAAKYGAEALAVATTVKLARALWIVPAFAGNGDGARRQGEDSVAVVHRPVLPGGGLQHVSAGWSARLRHHGESREDWIDRNSFPDRQRHLGGDDQARGTSSAVAGNHFVAAGSHWDRCG